MTTIKLNTLPIEVQNEVKDTLKAYDECNVVFANGEYHVSTSIMLLNVYPKDHKYIGDFYANDVFNDEEKILNYVNEFYDYPIEYKGDRDYRMLQKAQDSRYTEDEMTFILVDGNIVPEK